MDDLSPLKNIEPAKNVSREMHDVTTSSIFTESSIGKNVDSLGEDEEPFIVSEKTGNMMTGVKILEDASEISDSSSSTIKPIPDIKEPAPTTDVDASESS